MQPAAEVNECEERKQQNSCARKEAAYFISKVLFLTYYLLRRFIPPAALPLFLHTYPRVSAHWGSSSSNRPKQVPLSPSPSEVTTSLCGCPAVCNILGFSEQELFPIQAVQGMVSTYSRQLNPSSCGHQSRQAVTHRTNNVVVKFCWFYWNNLYA